MYDLSRRNLLRVSAAAVAAGAGLQGSAAEAAVRRTGPYLPYGRRSYFKSRVEGRLMNRERTREFRAFMRNHPDQCDIDYPMIKGVDGNDWGTAFAMGRPGDPVWRLEGPQEPLARRLTRHGFHAPEWLGRMLTGTNDSPLCVVDTVWGFTMFCTNAKVVGPRTIHGHGAITFHSSNGLDHRHPRANDARNFTSRGRISDAMVIRRDLVRYGVRHDTDLGHVLHMFLVETNSAAGHRGPMVGAEHGKHGFGAEGERIAIARSVDLSRRRLSPEARVIARTLQNYGCYFGDNAGSGSCLKAEQENDARPVWRGRLHRDSLSGLSWDDFVVLR